MRLPSVWSSFIMMKSDVLLIPAARKMAASAKVQLHRKVVLLTGEDLLCDLLLSISKEEQLEAGQLLALWQLILDAHNEVRRLLDVVMTRVGVRHLETDSNTQGKNKR